MPTNLPPEYFEVERRYKSAQSVKAKIECLEELLSTIPKHKGTDKLRADYRKRLSKLKSAPQTKKGLSRHESAFHIDKEGDGRVIVIGSANVGKSSLVAKYTHAVPEISSSPYSTWTPTPGMMNYENIHIQIIDTPPLDRDFIEPDLVDLIKNSDLILLMVDLQAFPIQQFQDNIKLLENHRIVPLHFKQRHSEEKLTPIPMIIVVNKDDEKKLDEDFEVLCELLEDEWSIISISLKENRNLEKLGEEIYIKMNIMRIYSKPPGKEVDRTQPFALKKGSTVLDFARKVHKDFYEKLKNARIWGSGVYDGQMVGRDHILQDGDIVELHL